MRAAVYHGNRHLEVADVPEPTVTEGTVKLQVSRNGICGSDLHEYYDGPIAVPPAGSPHATTGRHAPVIMGHEFSGIVTEVGREVRGLAEGDRVAIEPIYKCGTCEGCLTGHYNTCANLAFYGLMTDGGMAESCVVRQDTVFKLPDGVPVEMGALVEPMSVSYHAARMGDLSPDATAVVFGGGPIGIGVWFALRGLGVHDVLVVEPSPERRTALGALGADVLDPAAAPVVEQVMQRTGGRGAHVVYDAAGVPAVINQGLSCLRNRGALVVVAMQGFDVPAHLLLLLAGEKRMLGSMAYTAEDYRAVLALMARGHYTTDGWVETVPLSRVVEDGFEPLKAGRKLKLLVDPAH